MITSAGSRSPDPMASTTAKTADPSPAEAGDADLGKLREDKAARASARREASANAAADPGRRRVDVLREQREAQRPRPASALRPSPAVGRGGSATARAAAQRTPARVGLSKSQPGAAASKVRGGAKQGRGSLNAVVLLFMLLTLALVLGVGWAGYAWYQSLSTSDNTESINAPSDIFDVPSEVEAQEPAPSGIPTTETPQSPENQEVDVQDPALPTLPADEVTETGEATTDTSDEEVFDINPDFDEAQAYRNAVLSLERKLSQAFFLDPEFVDLTYTLETQNGLAEYANLFGIENLRDEISSAGLNPSRAELERWFEQI